MQQRYDSRSPDYNSDTLSLCHPPKMLAGQPPPPLPILNAIVLLLI